MNVPTQPLHDISREESATYDRATLDYIHRAAATGLGMEVVKVTASMMVGSKL